MIDYEWHGVMQEGGEKEPMGLGGVQHTYLTGNTASALGGLGDMITPSGASITCLSIGAPIDGFLLCLWPPPPGPPPACRPLVVRVVRCQPPAIGRPAHMGSTTRAAT